MAMRSKGNERKSTITRSRSEMSSGNGAHEHRTARVIELIGASRVSFEDAISNSLEDAGATLRGITGAHVENFMVKCRDGQVVEYRVNLKVAFGVERTDAP